MDLFLVGLFDPHADDWETVDGSEPSLDNTESSPHADMPYTKPKLLNMVQGATMCDWGYGQDARFYGRTISPVSFKQVAFFRHRQIVNPGRFAEIYYPVSPETVITGLSADYKYRQPLIAVCCTFGHDDVTVKNLASARETPDDPNILPRVVCHAIHDVELKSDWDHQLIPGCWNQLFLAQCPCEFAGRNHGHARNMVKDRVAYGLRRFASFWREYGMVETIVELILPANVDEIAAAAYTWEVSDDLCDEREVFGAPFPLEKFFVNDMRTEHLCEVCGEGCSPPAPESKVCRQYCGEEDESEEEW